MVQYNVHQAKSSLSHLLAQVAAGEEVIIARRGTPVARIVPVKRPGLVLGSALKDPNINRAALAKDQWWKPMSDKEAGAFVDGRR